MSKKSNSKTESTMMTDPNTQYSRQKSISVELADFQETRELTVMPTMVPRQSQERTATRITSIKHTDLFRERHAKQILIVIKD